MEENAWQEVICLIPYIINKARHYTIYTMDLEDLIQEGIITLYKKIPQYDESQDISYLRYIDYHLHLCFLNFLNKERYLVSMSKSIRVLAFKIEEFQSKAAANHQLLSTAELSKILNTPIQKIEYLERMNNNWKNSDKISLEEIKEAELNANISNKDIAMITMNQDQLEKVIDNIEVQEILTQLRKFSLIEQETFLRKLGFTNQEPETYEEIAESYHETFQNTQKRFKKVKQKLQKYYQ